MIRVKNERVIFTLKKDNKIIKSFDYTNRLTNLYLDYILGKHLNQYYYLRDEDPTIHPFSSCYLKFGTPDTLDDTSTTMNYDVVSNDLLPEDVSIFVGQSGKKMITNYVFYGDFSGLKPTMIGFGKSPFYNSNYLFSFIDLNVADFTIPSGTTLGITRVDEITTNEITTNGSFLPFKATSSNVEGYLDKIYYEYEDNSREAYNPWNWTALDTVGEFIVVDSPIPSIAIINDPSFDFRDKVRVGDKIQVVSSGVQEYEIESVSSNAIALTEFIPYQIITDLNTKQIQKIGVGEAIITTLNRFYKGDGLFPSNTLYPSDTLYPEARGQVKRVYFEYKLDNGTTQTTYIPIQMLDITYNNEEVLLKVKIERGNQ